MTSVESQQVSFWSVHEWAQRYIDAAPDFPMIGSPAWCALPDDDQRKWASVLDAAQHHALRVETSQEIRAAAAKQIAAVENWPQVAREMLGIESFRRMHPWSRRQAVRR